MKALSLWHSLMQKYSAEDFTEDQQLSSVVIKCRHSVHSNLKCLVTQLLVRQFAFEYTRVRSLKVPDRTVSILVVDQCIFSVVC